MPTIQDAIASLGKNPSGIRAIQSPEGLAFFLMTPTVDPQPFWHKLREVVPAFGYWPIMLGGDMRGLDKQLQSPREPGYGVRDILDRAARIDPTAWMEQWYQARMKDMAEFTEEGEAPYDPWKCSVDDVEDTGQPKVHFHSARKSPKGSPFLLVPTSIPSHVPAYFQFGGWNDCPYPDVQVAFHSYWERQHGSEIAVIAGDVVESFVRHPVTDRAQALKLAKEQYAYCHDIVEQGTETIPALASELLNSPIWFFWWD